MADFEKEPVESGRKKSEVDNAVDAIQAMMDRMDKKTFGSFVDIEREGSLDNNQI